MKTRFIIIFFLWATISNFAFSQDDSTVYRHGLPLSDDDTAQNFPSFDFSPKENVVIVPQSSLPKKVRAALTSEPQYKGWESMPVLFDKNTRLYLIQINQDTSVLVIGMNRNGQPVTYGTNTIEDE